MVPSSRGPAFVKWTKKGDGGGVWGSKMQGICKSTEPMYDADQR